MKPARLLLALGSVALGGVAHASTPVQLSLPGVNLPASHQVEGARASVLYGRTGQVKGIDLPVFALSDVDQFTGLQLGVFFRCRPGTPPVWRGGDQRTQLARGSGQGGQPWLRQPDQQCTGSQLGGRQHRQGQCPGQRRLRQLCRAHHLPAGFINATKHLDGLQVGLANYAENGVFPILPLINFKKSF